MRWEGGRKSDNVEDYRGSRFGGGGLKLGIGGTLIALVAAYFFGIDPRVILGLAQSAGGSGPDQPPQVGAPTDRAGQFVSIVLGDTEDTWTAIFQANGREYTPPKLDLFTSQINTGCGFADSGVGPFYCPSDNLVYIDLTFYQQLADQLGAPGEFAQPYVLAHEYGHHIQDLVGTEAKMRAAQNGASSSQKNLLSVKLELQADCYAGVWANHATATKSAGGQPIFKSITDQDIQQGLDTAKQIGDDTLQQRAGQQINPAEFTHGTSADRQKWFKRGFDSGDPAKACDTFAAGAVNQGD
jgi:uncharacterized protein